MFYFSIVKRIIYFVLISHSINGAVSNPDYVQLNDSMIVDNQLERIWKEAIDTYFKVLSQHLHGVTEEDYKTPQSIHCLGRDSIPAPSVYKS
jgi:hypothetical protein